MATRLTNNRSRTRLLSGFAGPAVFVLVLLAPSDPTNAAGFYINSVGTPGSLGTAAAANVTNDWGPDATWANPAGLVGTGDRHVMTAGLQALIPVAEFDVSVAEAGGDDGGNAGDIALIPSFFYSQRLDEDWAFGFGVSALQGGGVDYGNNFAGRYGAIDVKLTGLAATWSLGRQITDKLSIGFGGSLIQTDFQLISLLLPFLRYLLICLHRDLREVRYLMRDLHLAVPR